MHYSHGGPTAVWSAIVTAFTLPAVGFEKGESCPTFSLLESDTCPIDHLELAHFDKFSSCMQTSTDELG